MKYETKINEKPKIIEVLKLGNVAVFRLILRGMLSRYPGISMQHIE